MTAPFSSLVQLRTLHVVIPVQHHPLPSVMQTNAAVPLHTPSSSPTMVKSTLPPSDLGNPSPPTSLLDLHHGPEELHPALRE